MDHLDRRKTARGHAVIALLAVAPLSVVGTLVGFWIGHHQQPPIDAHPVAAAVQPLAVEVLPHCESVPDPSPNLSAMGARLEELQAQLLRLDALGERLVRMSGADPEEFDFQHPPPRGGAEDGRAQDYTIREIANELSSMVSLVRDRERKLDRLGELISEGELVMRDSPSGWPVRTGYISSRYGFRVHPIKKRRLFHEGVDFASPRGTPIHAVADGVVIFDGRRSGYGRMVDIRHADGLVTRYAHNQDNLVKEGQTVREGQKIATVGSSGTATGPHVHFEVIRDGKAIDPMFFIERQPRPILAGEAKDRAS